MSGIDHRRRFEIRKQEGSPFSPPDVKHLWRRGLAWTTDWMAIGTLASVLLGSRARPLLSPSHAQRFGHLVFLPTHQLVLNLAFDYGLALGVFIAYFTMLEWAFGLTIGKLIFGLRVVDFSGRDITFGQALIRNLFRIVDGVPAGLNLIGWLKAASGERRQRWGDKGAGTLVIRSSAKTRMHLEEEAAVNPAPSLLAIRQV